MKDQDMDDDEIARSILKPRREAVVTQTNHAPKRQRDQKHG